MPTHDADFGGAAEGAAVQGEGRAARCAHDLDVAPPDAAAIAGAERLHHRFLGCESRRKTLGVASALQAVCDLAGGEDAKPEALAPLRMVDRTAHAFDLDDVGADGDDHVERTLSMPHTNDTSPCHRVQSAG